MATSDEIFDPTLDDIEAEIGELGGGNDGDASVDANHAEAVVVASPAPKTAEPSAGAEAEPSVAEAAPQENKENGMVPGPPSDTTAAPAGPNTAAAPPAAKPAIPMKRKALTVAKAANNGGAAGSGSNALQPAPSAAPAAATAAAKTAAAQHAKQQEASVATAEAAATTPTASGPAADAPESMVGDGPSMVEEAPTGREEEEGQAADHGVEGGEQEADQVQEEPSEAPGDSAPATSVPAPAALPPKKRGLAAPKAKKDGTGDGAAPTQPAHKPRAPKAVTAPKAAGAPKAPAGPKAAPAPKLPRARNAFMIFAEEWRPKMKAEDPSLSTTQVGSLMGQKWRNMTTEEKAPYQAKADAEKKEVEAKLAEMGGDAVAAIKEAQKEARAAKKDKQQGSATTGGASAGGAAAGAAPAAGGGGRKRKAKVVEDEAGDSEAQQQDDAAAEVSVAPSTSTAPLPSAPAPAKRRRAPAGAGRKRGRKGAGAGAAGQASAQVDADGSGGEDDDECASPGGDGRAQGSRRGRGGGGGGGADEESDDSDREDVDWEGHAAEGIFALGPRDKFLVRRRGLDLTKYGTVDARKAKRMRIGGASGGDDPSSTLPVGLPELEEYEAFEERFWREIRDHTQGDNIELDDLPEGSSLEMVYVLGKLREEGGPLDVRATARQAAKGPRKDFKISVPALRLSMVVQRMMELERRAGQEERARLVARVAELEAGSSAASKGLPATAKGVAA